MNDAPASETEAKRRARAAPAEPANARAAAASPPQAASVALWGGARLLFVMATTQEYTPALASRIVPLITGVGPVEAGVHLGAALGALAAIGALPELIVALGSAGSRTLTHAAIYQASSVSYRDMDCTPLGFARGVTPFLSAPPTLPLGPALARLPAATLATGASIVTGAGYDSVDADMVDMETYAYARAAAAFGVALISLRGISDGRAPLERLADWTHTLEEIGAGLGAALDDLASALAIGEIHLDHARVVAPPLA